VNRLKNQHLLAIIIVLSALSTVMGLNLIMSERRNGQQIEVLTRQLADAQHQRQESESAITAKLSELRSDQTDARRQHEDALAGAQRKITALSQDLAPVHQKIQALDKEQAQLRNLFGQVAKDVSKELNNMHKRLTALELPPKLPVKEPIKEKPK